MNDCKHKHFQGNCMVCWFKLGHGIKVHDAPIRGDEGTDKHRQDCINMARGIGEVKLRAMKRHIQWGVK